VYCASRSGSKSSIHSTCEAVEKDVKACFVNICPMRIRINTCCIDGSAGSNMRARYKLSRTQS
jgi:hypothetical protein